MRLYPAQQAAVDAFRARRSPRRRIFAWGTGCGKTAGACSSICDDHRRVLIICPALVRRHWLRELATWAPQRVDEVAVIEWGRDRAVTGGVAATRKRAYAASIQIVSYDLLHHVDDGPWDLIVADEIHHIAEPTTAVARAFAAKLDANPNPKADVLGLSATLIPTEAIQLWNPMRLLFPHAGWGEPHTDGSPSWKFRWRYCNVEKTRYGSSVFGVRDDRRSELRTRLLRHCDVLRREDIAADLPPLDLHVLQLAAPAKSGRWVDTSRVVARCFHWACGASADKLVVLTHHREAARDIYELIRTQGLQLKDHQLFYVDGSLPTARRDAVLTAAAATERCVLVGTHDSLNEGVRMMWADAALIDEWGQSPGRMVQLMGRFQSVGSALRPAVYLAADANSYGAAQQLMYRISVVQDVMATATSADTLKERLAALGQLSAEDLNAAFADMFAEAGVAAARDAWIEGDDATV